MKPVREVLAELKRSTFRRRFRLGPADRAYVGERGMDAIMQHAGKLIDERLVPAHPKNDGKQTPWRGHPVFVAQHATATCCRTCLAKWHGIAKGVAIGPEERYYVLAVIRAWIDEQTADVKRPPTLFDPR